METAFGGRCNAKCVLGSGTLMKVTAQLLMCQRKCRPANDDVQTSNRKVQGCCPADFAIGLWCRQCLPLVLACAAMFS